MSGYSDTAGLASAVRRTPRLQPHQQSQQQPTWGNIDALSSTSAGKQHSHAATTATTATSHDSNNHSSNDDNNDDTTPFLVEKAHLGGCWRKANCAKHRKALLAKNCFRPTLFAVAALSILSILVFPVPDRFDHQELTFSCPRTSHIDIEHDAALRSANASSLLLLSELSSLVMPATATALPTPSVSVDASSRLATAKVSKKSPRGHLHDDDGDDDDDEDDDEGEWRGGSSRRRLYHVLGEWVSSLFESTEDTSGGSSAADASPSSPPRPSSCSACQPEATVPPAAILPPWVGLLSQQPVTFDEYRHALANLELVRFNVTAENQEAVSKYFNDTLQDLRIPPGSVVTAIPHARYRTCGSQAFVPALGLRPEDLGHCPTRFVLHGQETPPIYIYSAGHLRTISATSPYQQAYLSKAGVPYVLFMHTWSQPKHNDKTWHTKNNPRPDDELDPEEQGGLNASDWHGIHKLAKLHRPYLQNAFIMMEDYLEVRDQSRRLRFPNIPNHYQDGVNADLVAVQHYTYFMVHSLAKATILATTGLEMHPAATIVRLRPDITMQEVQLGCFQRALLQDPLVFYGSCNDPGKAWRSKKVSDIYFVTSRLVMDKLTTFDAVRYLEDHSDDFGYPEEILRELLDMLGVKLVWWREADFFLWRNKHESDKRPYRCERF
ncbi:hypothetical protein CAOG_04200 [Capsaspora owczarzaki ATCC 30864]|uniref:hypothetical protein n=1 Tax=Capsaspora owczarzaki (strain ATCC 30864) TaxID=595528 RepID=UPI0001FE407E|nr:hypothetical protein CAOG_04200 [Capsaspora owczarzaki ATCC 30864]|eukprot:XP_004348025.1 hypothetical protein CAOG_04200 [Capsaspora owczarzaki ATCC 30864]